MTAAAVTHVDPGDLVCFAHEAHLVVSTARRCGCVHHFADADDGWCIALGDDDSLPDWAVLKAGAA